MIFGLTHEKPLLQRQLDADRERWTRALQLETDGDFDDSQKQAFRMNGLFDEIPGSAQPPLPLSPRPS